MKKNKNSLQLGLVELLLNLVNGSFQIMFTCNNYIPAIIKPRACPFY